MYSIYIYMCVCVYIYLSISIYLYIYIYVVGQNKCSDIANCSWTSVVTAMCKQQVFDKISFYS